jgi:hypothetical protein
MEVVVARDTSSVKEDASDGGPMLVTGALSLVI